MIATLSVITIFLCLLVAIVGAVQASFWLTLPPTILATAIRLLAVYLGYIHGTTPVRLVDVLVATTFVCLAASIRQFFRPKTRGRGQGGHLQPDQTVGVMAGLLTLPVAAYALLQLLGPTATAAAGGPPCEGAPVAGSAFQVKTTPDGLNGRLGPGTTFAAADRFDGSCVVGVDGYCVGEGVNDIGVPLEDVRWFRVRHSEVFVSAGRVFALSPEEELGGAPEEDCPLGLEDPVLDGDVKISRVDDDSLELSARPVRTTLVGFGLLYGLFAVEGVEVGGASVAG